MKRLTIDQLDDQGCMNVLCAFMERLSEDYRDSLAILRKNPRSKENLRHVRELREYFTSEEFGLLTNLDGKAIVEKLEYYYCPKSLATMIKSSYSDASLLMDKKSQYKRRKTA